MFGKLFKREKGFTLIELMASLVIFSLALTAISQAMVTGVRVTNKQANQVDLRRNSRDIVTLMERDIQNAANIAVQSSPPPQHFVQILLKDVSGNTYERLVYDSTKQSITKYTGTNTQVIATNVNTATFNNLTPDQDITTPYLNSIPISLRLAEGQGQAQDNLSVNTEASPRWNMGNGVPAIVSIQPNILTWGQTQYNLTNIIGVNTHFNANSVVTFRDGSTVYATSSGQTLTASSDGTSLSNVTLHTVDGQKLPLGYYDLYVDTPLVDASGNVTGTETVYAVSVITCMWDPTDWVLVGNYDSSGYDPTHFPYVIKAANNNDKVDYYVANNLTDFNVQVGIDLSQDTLKYSYNNHPDAEVALWQDPSNGAKNNTYVGFGINQNSVFIRYVVNGTVTTQIKVNGIQVHDAQATLKATAVDGVLHFWVDGTNIDSIVDGQNSSIRTGWPTPSGYLGVTVPNTKMAVTFVIMRM